MKSTLISLLDQLPLALDGSLQNNIVVSKEFTIPKFHNPIEQFPETYLFDTLNNQIISYLQNKWYSISWTIIDSPKIPGSDLVIDTKSLYELNKTDNFKEFVDKLYQDLSESTSLALCAISQQWIFINIKVNDSYLHEHSKQVLQHVGFWTIQYETYSNKKLMMEYSSPNMAKSMTIGHFRNTIIGQIMYNIIQQTWCPHFNWNYIGDRGTAFGKFITILRYSYKQNPSIVDNITNNPQEHLGPLYAEFKNCAREQKEDIARKIVSLMEQGNEIIIELRKIIRKLSLIDFETVYESLHVKFDCNLWESFSVKLDNNIDSDLKNHDILHESQGALIIKMKRSETGKRKPLQSSELESREEWVDQVLVFAKSDGSTLYAPRDLALLKYRSQELWIDNLIYVVGSEQSGYFEHIISIGEYLWWVNPNAMLHLWYGLYLQNGKKMSSRAGGVLGAHELIQDITQAILAQSEGRIDEKTAEKLAVSALIINDTKGDISKDVNLDIPSMTKLSGDTGLYIQYTAVRLRSLLERLQEGRNWRNEEIIDISVIGDELRALLFQSSLLPQKIIHALNLFKPHILTQYLLDLSARFNKRYNDSEKVLDMNDKQKESVMIVLSVYQIVLEKVMNLLHLPKVEKM